MHSTKNRWSQFPQFQLNTWVRREMWGKEAVKDQMAWFGLSPECLSTELAPRYGEASAQMLFPDHAWEKKLGTTTFPL